jgi:hypothetical protein
LDGSARDAAILPLNCGLLDADKENSSAAAASSEAPGSTMATRNGISKGSVLAAFALAATALGNGDHSDLRIHLDYARNSLERGAYGRVMAHTDAVLFERPLRVHCDLTDLERDQRDRCEAALQAAIDLWREALDHRVEFVAASSSYRADLRVRFVPDLRVRGRAVAGYIDWKRMVQGTDEDSEATLSADLQIRTAIPGGGRMSVMAMRHAMAHELGHVFGLGDRRSGIMGPVNPRRPVERISQSEIDEVLNLRREAEDIRATAMVRALILP